MLARTTTFPTNYFLDTMNVFFKAAKISRDNEGLYYGKIFERELCYILDAENRSLTSSNMQGHMKGSDAFFTRLRPRPWRDVLWKDYRPNISFHRKG